MSLSFLRAQRGAPLLAVALLGASLSLAPAGTTVAATLAGVEVEDSLEVAGETLTLNGVGLRKRFFVKLYVAGLYTQEGAGDGDAIVQADAPMALTLDIVSDRVTRDKMVEALNDGFAASTGGDTAPVEAGIAQLREAMGDTLEAGASMAFVYEPGVGTRVSRDGSETAVIEGLPFKQALFGIWLSGTPADAKLKSALLGS